MINLPLNDVNAERHYQLVKQKIRNRIYSLLKRRYILRNKIKIPLDSTSNRFLLLLSKGLWLKKLITAKPNELIDILTYVRTNYQDLVTNTTDSYRIIYNLFINHGYDSEDFNKLNFINDINMDSCAYCNRSYTYALAKIDKIKPEIDHFYPKDIYPFFGLSFYNLIPSCQTCNGLSGKRVQDPSVIGLTNPYMIKSSDFKFSYKINSIKVLNPLIDPKSVGVVFKNKVQGHLDVFKLDKLYERHTDHLLELIIKSKLIYTEKYRTYLRNYKKLKFSNHEIDRMIVGNYTRENEIHKRPLAKLYQDIAKELGLM